jgi:carbohydrate kinase (thermoresistant glucokinase family)
MNSSLVIMGVASCGKWSLATAIAQVAGMHLIGSDDRHSTDSREKMKRGIPLTDADRSGWLIWRNRCAYGPAVAAIADPRLALVANRRKDRRTGQKIPLSEVLTLSTTPCLIPKETPNGC